MRTTIAVKTHARSEMIDITAQVQQALADHTITQGTCMLFVPHTTAAVTINESADPSVREDIMTILDRLVPWQADYRHLEGNSAAHAKASLVGASELIQVIEGRLALGTWQGIFFCEFDGPRARKLDISIVGA
jgi:secondary thiamine-phosphate synthase enzyme